LEVLEIVPYIALELQTQYKVNIPIMNMKRNRRSEPLTRDEHEAFKTLFLSFPTKVDAEFYFNLKRQILDGVFYKGSGSTETIKVIRRKLNKIAA
jgi:hypothetical protein